MTCLDSILKSRDITLSTKVRLVKAMAFPVVMYGCESWTIKKAEHRIIDAFVLWCWRRLLRVPWIARRSNQFILNVLWKDRWWSSNSNTLATWCEELTHWKRPWFWERLKAVGEGDNRGWDGWMYHWLDGHEFEQASGMGVDREAWHTSVHGVAKSQTWLCDWTKQSLQILKIVLL